MFQGWRWVVLNVCKRDTCQGTAVGFCTQDDDHNCSKPFSGQPEEVSHILPDHYKSKMKHAAGALSQVSISRVSLGRFTQRPNNDQARRGDRRRVESSQLWYMNSLACGQGFCENSACYPKLMPFSLLSADKRTLCEFWGHSLGSSIISPGTQSSAAGWENSSSENPAPQGPSSELQGYFAHGGKSTCWLQLQNNCNWNI